MSALQTGCGPLADGTSLPDAQRLVANLRELGHTVDVDDRLLGLVAAYFRKMARAEGLPTGAPSDFDAAFLRHQMAGGTMTTMRRQLAELGLAAPLRRDDRRGRRGSAATSGCPIMVTPFPQIVISQALANVIGDRRYDHVPDQVIRYVLGRFGRPTGPVDDDVRDRILDRDRAPGDRRRTAAAPAVGAAQAVPGEPLRRRVPAARDHAGRARSTRWSPPGPRSGTTTPTSPVFSRCCAASRAGRASGPDRHQARLPALPAVARMTAPDRLRAARGLRPRRRRHPGARNARRRRLRPAARCRRAHRAARRPRRPLRGVHQRLGEEPRLLRRRAAGDRPDHPRRRRPHAREQRDRRAHAPGATAGCWRWARGTGSARR